MWDISKALLDFLGGIQMIIGLVMFAFFVIIGINEGFRWAWYQMFVSPWDNMRLRQRIRKNVFAYDDHREVIFIPDFKGPRLRKTVRTPNEIRRAVGLPEVEGEN